jgi:hypothetical protein
LGCSRHFPVGVHTDISHLRCKNRAQPRCFLLFADAILARAREQAACSWRPLPRARPYRFGNKTKILCPEVAGF